MRYSLVYVLLLMGLALGCDYGEDAEPERQTVELTAEDFKDVQDPRAFLIELQAKGAIPEADVNRDGVVDISDLVIVARNFGLEVVLDEPLPGLPVDTAGYERWLRLNAEPIPPRAADPHNGTKNVYTNQRRNVIAPGGKQVFPYPDGTIIVKDATRPGRDFIGLVAVMWKVKGIDPAHGDWRFIEYVRDAADQPFREIAWGATCWGCHSGAVDTDWAFTRLD